MFSLPTGGAGSGSGQQRAERAERFSESSTAANLDLLRPQFAQRLHMDPKKLGSYGRTGLRGAKSLQVTGEGPHPRQWANKGLEAGGIGLGRTWKSRWKWRFVGIGRRNTTRSNVGVRLAFALSPSMGSLFTDYLQ